MKIHLKIVKEVHSSVPHEVWFEKIYDSIPYIPDKGYIIVGDKRTYIENITTEYSDELITITVFVH